MYDVLFIVLSIGLVTMAMYLNEVELGEEI